MNVIINDSHLTDIANAIREKNGIEDLFKPSEMAAAIAAITTGGGDVLNGFDFNSLGFAEISGTSSTYDSLPDLTSFVSDFSKVVVMVWWHTSTAVGVYFRGLNDGEIYNKILSLNTTGAYVTPFDEEIVYYIDGDITGMKFYTYTADTQSSTAQTSAFTKKLYMLYEE